MGGCCPHAYYSREGAGGTTMAWLIFICTVATHKIPLLLAVRHACMRLLVRPVGGGALPLLDRMNGGLHIQDK